MPRSLDYSARTILSLAVPALAALVIEPLLVLIDSVMIGHLGSASLAGLSLASTILMTVVGVFVFLAYATTASTARALGQGNRAQGIRQGIAAMWLALGLGVIVVAGLFIGAPWIVELLRPDPSVAPNAITYLRAASFGSAPMLVILAATGTLRGLLDMRTPLVVLAYGSILNVGLNLLLVFGLRLGLLGAGIGLSITQSLMALALVLKVLKGARRDGVSLGPSKSGMISAAWQGFPLFIRTVSLRLALLATVTIAGQIGIEALAGHQIVNSVWSLTAFAIDALAIAAQSLVGVALGSGSQRILRDLVRRLTAWGFVAALILGLSVSVLSPWIPALFGSTTELSQVASAALLAAGLLMPLSGGVFILDGVLIGADQGKYLAWAGIFTLVAYLPALALLQVWVTNNAPLDVSQQTMALTFLWIVFAGWFQLTRLVLNAWRAFGKILVPRVQ